MEKTVSAVLVAAGSSTRMGFDKLSFDLGGETVLHRSIRAFAQCPQVTEIVLVAGKNREFVAQQAADCPKPVQIVAGGATRAESAKNGVLAAHGELVAVHDAARPFVSAVVITAALEAAARCGAAAPAVPVKDTIKAAARGDGKTVPPDCAVCATPDRSTLYAVQTPQCFDRAAYLAALEELDETRARLVTDDCSLFELTGRPVQLTQGDYANLKITTREDLPRPAQRKETEMRIGHGYDVHRLVEQRKLILGGVEIPFEKCPDVYCGYPAGYFRRSIHQCRGFPEPGYPEDRCPWSGCLRFRYRRRRSARKGYVQADPWKDQSADRFCRRICRSHGSTSISESRCGG